MSWHHGADLADKLWASVEKKLPNDTETRDIARQWVLMFEALGCTSMEQTQVGEAAGLTTTEELGTHFAWKKP